MFTREVVKRARPDARVLVFEVDPALQAMIRREHPGLKLYGDAQALLSIMKDEGIEKLDFVISSLPFTVLPPGDDRTHPGRRPGDSGPRRPVCGLSVLQNHEGPF